MREPKPYRARIWGYAVKETRRYWNLYRTITAITAPVVTSLFWLEISGRRGFLEVLYGFILGLLLFFAGWGVAFMVSLCRAPAALDAECQGIVRNLSTQLELPDRALADHLTNLLDKVGKAEKDTIKFLLLHEEEVSVHDIKIEGLSDSQCAGALYTCVREGLLRTGIKPSGQFQIAYYWIPKRFGPTLKRLLYRESEELPPQAKDI